MFSATTKDQQHSGNNANISSWDWYDVRESRVKTFLKSHSDGRTVYTIIPNVLYLKRVLKT